MENYNEMNNLDSGVSSPESFNVGEGGDPITPQEFAKKIKQKYPQYKDMDDVTLSKKIIDKYPQYKGQVNFNTPTNKATPKTAPIVEGDDLGGLPKPKGNFIDKTQQAALNKPKVGATVKTQTVDDHIDKNIQKIEDEKVRLKDKYGVKVEDRLFTEAPTIKDLRKKDFKPVSAEEEILKKKIELPDYQNIEAASPEIKDVVTKQYKDLDALGVDGDDFAGYIAEKTDFLDNIKSGAFDNPKEKEFKLNKYAQDYFVDRGRFLQSKIDIETKRGNAEKVNAAKGELKNLGGQYEDYKKNNLPEYYKEEQSELQKDKEYYQSIKEGKRGVINDLGRTIQESLKGATYALSDMVATAGDIVGADKVSDKLRLQKDYINWKQDTGNVMYEEGKSVDYSGNKYLVTSDGKIIDKDTKTSVNGFLSQKERDTINDLADRSKESDSVFSGRGALYGGGGVLGNLAVQLVGTKGVGGAVAKTGITGESAAVISEMISVGSMVGSSTYNDTVSQLRNAGIRDEDAKGVAMKVAMLTSAASMLSTKFMPNTQSQKLLEKDGVKGIITSSIAAFKNEGKEGLNKYLQSGAFKTFAAGMKEGTGEALQENFENFTQKMANSAGNDDLNQKVLDTDYTLKDVIENSVMAFSSAGMLGTVSGATEHLINDNKFENLQLLSKDYDKFATSGQDMVNRGYAKQEDFDKLKKQVDNFRKFSNKIPDNYKGDKAIDLINSIAERDDLEQQKKNLDKAFHPEIDAKIEEVTTKIDTVKNEKDTTETDRLEKDNQGSERKANIGETEGKTKVTNFDKDVKRIVEASPETEDGHTFNLDGTTYDKGGLVIPVVSENMKQSELTPDKIQEFVDKHQDKIDGESVKVGIYKFPNSDEVSIDLNIVAPAHMKDEAIKFGKDAGQESLFDLNTSENIKTGSDGKAPKEFSAEEFKTIAKKFSSKQSVPDKTAENMTEDGEGNYVFYHYSPKEFDALDPNKSGSNGKAITTAGETGAWSNAGGVNYLYVRDDQRENAVSGNNGYEFKVPKSEVYDTDADVNNYKEKAVQEYKDSHNGDTPNGNIVAALITKAASEDGYKVTVSGWEGGVRAQTNQPLKPSDTMKMSNNSVVKDFGNKYQSNYDKKIQNSDKFDFKSFNEFVDYLQTKFYKNGTVDNLVGIRQDAVIDRIIKSKIPDTYKKTMLSVLKKEGLTGALRSIPEDIKSKLEQVELPNNENVSEKNKGDQKGEDAKAESVLPKTVSEEDFKKINLSNDLGIDKVVAFLDNIDKQLAQFGQGTLGMNLPIVVARGAIKAMKAAVKTAKTGADIISAGINFVRESEWYKSLNDSDKQAFEDKGLLSYLSDTENKDVAERVVKKETVGKNENPKTTIRKTTGQTDTSTKVVTTESKSLKEKYKNLQRGFKTGSSEVQQLKRGFIDQLKADLKGLGKDMNQSEVNSILSQVGKINDKNIDAVEKVIDRVIEKINDRIQNREIATIKKRVKKQSKSKSKSTPRNIKDLARAASMIDEKYLSGKDKENFLKLLQSVDDTFRGIGDDKYQMVDYDQAMEKVEALWSMVEDSKAQEMADRLGIDAEDLSYKDLLGLWNDENADEYAENLSEAKRKEVRDAFTRQAEYAKMSLEDADTTEMSKNERKAFESLKKIDFDTMNLEDIKRYVKLADNIVVNGDFSNVGAITAKVNANESVKDLIKFMKDKGIKPSKIDNAHYTSKLLGITIPPSLNVGEWIKHLVNNLTTLNVFMDSIMGGSKAGSKLYNDSGFLDLSNARVRATVRKTNFDDYLNNLITKLAKTNPSIRDGGQVIKRSVYATLLQAEKGSVESMEFFKKNYIEKSIQSLKEYSNNKQADAKMEILAALLNDLEGVKTKEELIDHIKNNDPDNHKILKSVSDYFLRHSQEFSDNSYFNHGETFEMMGEDDFYLPLSRKSMVPKSMREKLDEVKSSMNFMSYASTDSKSGSIFSRKKNAKLGKSETINFDFDSFISQKYGEQIYDIESAQEILKLKAVLTHPDMVKEFGSSMVELIDRALNKIAIDSGAATNSTSDIEKKVLKVERAFRKIGSINALGGVDQYLKQYPSVIIGASIRLGADMRLLPHYMFTNKADIELLKLSSIRMRKEANAGTKRASDDIVFSELSVDEKNKVERIASELSRGLEIGLDKARELTMLSLRQGDVNAAGTTFLAYYHSHLLKSGVAEEDIDMRTEHVKINEGDKVRKDALAYAQHMVNTTQTSSDLSEGSNLAMNPTAAAKLLSGVVIPFSTFSNNAMIRFMKAVGNIKRNPKENMSEAVASLSEIIAFQSIKALALAPAAAVIGKVLFGGDDEDEKDVIDWEFQLSKMMSGVVGDMHPLPDSFDIDAMNYMLYLANKDKIGGDNPDFSFRDYDAKLKKMRKDPPKDKEIPFQFYRYGDADGWDLANGVKSDLGMYQIPMEQVKKTYEAWDVMIDGEKTEYSKYGKKEHYNFDDKHKNFLMFYTLTEVAATVGFSDAFSRRILEKEFTNRKRGSKESSSKKNKIVGGTL